MAFAPLNLQAEIWKIAGLSHILAQDVLLANHAPVAENKTLSRNQFKSEPIKNPAPSPVPHPDTQSCQKDKVEEWHALQLDQWPHAWKEQLQRIRRAIFAWTYLDLGNDLVKSNAQIKEAQEFIQKRTARGNFLRSLFQQLAFPAGSNCLWPVSLPATSGNSQLEHDLFWSGIEKLGCHGVIIFGSGASRIAFPDKSLKPLSCFRAHGALTVILWDIDGLAERIAMHAEVTEYLRSCLRQICGK